MASPETLLGRRLTLSSQTGQQERLVFFKPPKTAHNFSLRRQEGQRPSRASESVRTKWQKRVVRIKENVTIAPSYEDLYEKSPHLIPNDFSGNLCLGDLEFRWRSVKAFLHPYLAISGKREETCWNLVTFCLQLPEGIDKKTEENMLQQAEGLYTTSYHAIRCAIFERCQEEVNGVNNNHNGNGQ